MLNYGDSALLKRVSAPRLSGAHAMLPNSWEGADRPSPFHFFVHVQGEESESTNNISNSDASQLAPLVLFSRP